MRLQQSIHAQSAKLAQPSRSAGEPRSLAARAYDLDRQGQQFYREKKYDEAVKKCQEAVNLKPGDALLLNNLGFIYYQMGRYDDSLTYLQKTLAIDPKRKEAHLNIADLFLKLGRRAEAQAALRGVPGAVSDFVAGGRCAADSGGVELGPACGVPCRPGSDALAEPRTSESGCRRLHRLFPDGPLGRAVVSRETGFVSRETNRPSVSRPGCAILNLRT